MANVSLIIDGIQSSDPDRIRRFCASALLSVLTLLLFTTPSATADSQNSRRVLLMYADEKDLPMNLIIDERLRASFREKLGDRVELFSEHIDISRFPDSRIHRKQLEFLREKHSAHGLDLIVAIDHPALDLIQSHRDWFFPATPVVFCCVTEAEYRARRIEPRVLGVPVKLDYGRTLELALRLHPGTRHAVVIAGATKDDIATVADARRDFRPFEDTVECRYLVGLPMADLRQEVSQLSGDSIIIYLSIARDGAGTSFFPREALLQVSQVASVPIYGYYDSYLGHGIVGGFLASFEIEATTAARLGLRILAGEKPEDLSADEPTSCAYLFDWRQLNRWGIDEADLPTGSVARFRNPSFWDLYRWHVIGILSLCAIQTLLILGLLVQRARGRRAEKQAEEARLELAHASRLTLVGELTASIAHEINQPLGAILSNADAAEMLLESSPPALGQVREILGDIRNDDLRASEVIRRLRALLRKREMESQPVDLNEVTSDVMLLVRPESRSRSVLLEFAPADDLPLVRGDKVHLQQVVLNLVFNGMEAMADVQGEKRVSVHATKNESGSVEVAVSDTGPGILPDRLPRLFDPFFSTKKEGMGLGLSIARSLVEAHGGTIWAENNRERGATFRFTLPPDREQPNLKSRSAQRAPVGARS
jgi:signal transduction histidine kinase